MSGNYAPIILENIRRVFDGRGPEAAQAMGGRFENGSFQLRAFGKDCQISRDGVVLDGEPEHGPLGVVISLYALHSRDLPVTAGPFKAFKEMRDSAPYAGAFATHTEKILVPKVEALRAAGPSLAGMLDGGPGPEDSPGDFSWLAAPLPKIRLCYIFYLPDEDFPASVTCLFSNNAGEFMPTDGLADVGEYTSRTLLDLLKNGGRP